MELSKLNENKNIFYLGIKQLTANLINLLTKSEMCV